MKNFSKFCKSTGINTFGKRPEFNFLLKLGSGQNTLTLVTRDKKEMLEFAKKMTLEEISNRRKNEPNYLEKNAKEWLQELEVKLNKLKRIN